MALPGCLQKEPSGLEGSIRLNAPVNLSFLKTRQSSVLLFHIISFLGRWLVSCPRLLLQRVNLIKVAEGRRRESALCHAEGLGTLSGGGGGLCATPAGVRCRCVCFLALPRVGAQGQRGDGRPMTLSHILQRGNLTLKDAPSSLPGSFLPINLFSFFRMTK